MPTAATQPRSSSPLTPDDWRSARSLVHAHASPDEVDRQLARLGLTAIPPSTWAAQTDEAALAIVRHGLIDQVAAHAAREHAATNDQYRAADGSRVWRTPDGTIHGLTGNITETDSSDAFAPDRSTTDFAPPTVLVGVDPPAMLHRLWTDSAARANGYAPRLFVCEPDAAALVSALADLALRLGPEAVDAMLGSDRVAWYVGPHSPAHLADRLRTGLDESLPQRILVTPGTPLQSVAKAVAAALQHAHQAQHDVLRDMQNHRPRWAPTAWTDRPARVQILTSRYTAYVRFSAEDLARQFRAMGIDARVLQERDASSHANPLYFARRIDDFRPDLIVSINYLRPHTGDAVPPNVPVVSWIQDAMPHLLTSDRTWRAGGADFVAGFIYPSLRDDFGFSPERTLPWTNAVSVETFHRGPTAPGSDHLRCEIAMATRHSEPPRAYFERAVRALGPDTPAGRAAQRVGSGIGGVLEAAATPWRYLSGDLAALTRAALREATGAEPANTAETVLFNTFTLPLADLLFRQQTATWAAAIAERRGWRFHLYGPGWSEHPTLARFARPELTHGEELRAAYQLANVHLHASVRAPAHQRIAEIALSGGVPLVRRTFEDMDRSRRCLLNELHGAPRDLSMAKGRHPAYWVSNHPGAMRLAAEWGRLGCTLTDHGFFGNSPAEIAQIESTPPDRLLTTKDDPNRLLLDLAETTFASEQELEQRVEAMTNPRRRERVSSAVARRCRDRFGLDHFAERLIELVRPR